MSFKLKRRDSSGEPTDAPKQETGEKKKYSVTGYICLLFAVVIILVVMSYFVQQRNNNITLDSLLQQHDNVTSQAFANIEKLQDSNMELMDENEALSEEIEDLKAELEAIEDEKEALVGSHSAVQTENKALKELLELQIAIDSGDTDKAAAGIEAVKASTLPQEYKAKFDALCAQYENMSAADYAETENE